MPFLALFFGVGVVLGFLVNVAEIALYARFTGLCNSFGFWALLSLRFWCLAIKFFYGGYYEFKRFVQSSRYSLGY